jgi:multiple sugar transport system permease protein
MSTANLTYKKKNNPFGSILFYGFCTIVAIAFIFPLVWSLITSLKPAAEASASPPTFLPSRISLENFSYLANYSIGIFAYVLNSLIVATITVVGTVVLSVLAGYGFSRFEFPGKHILFLIVLTTLMIPFQSILTPLYILLRVIHLQNTLLGLGLVYITFQIPFAVFMMRNAFESVPRELEEAALLDGCTPLTLLTRVMLPVVLPGVITVGLFAFFASWNEFLAALIFMSDSEKFTLPVMLLNAQSQIFGAINWGAMEAGLAITMIPCAVIFLLLQRYYISGLISGAVK